VQLNEFLRADCRRINAGDRFDELRHNNVNGCVKFLISSSSSLLYSLLRQDRMIVQLSELHCSISQSIGDRVLSWSEAPNRCCFIDLDRETTTMASKFNIIILKSCGSKKNVNTLSERGEKSNKSAAHWKPQPNVRKLINYFPVSGGVVS